MTTLATVDHDLLAALSDLAKAVGAPSHPVARRARSKTSPPTGVLTAEAIGQSLCALMPENAILVDEGATNGGAIYDETEGARAHDFLKAGNGGAIGHGLPVALGAAVFASSSYGRAFWQFMQSARLELRKVVWPTRQETATTTAVVFGFVIIAGLFFWALDVFLSWATRLLTGQGG